jgi:hypothetical protein
MGLDIYLVTRKTAAAQDAHEEAWTALYERKDRGEITEEQYEQEREALPPYVHNEDVPSERHPQHLFNRRYLRSSYNGGGFNRAVPELLGDPNATLDYLFEPVRLDDQYEIELTEASVRGLAEAKRRALEVVEQLRDCDPLRVTTASPNIFLGTQKVGEADALRWFRAELKRHAGAELHEDAVKHGYSSRDGEYFGEDGLNVLAAVPGVGTFGEPAVHLIYRQAEEGLRSYIESAEIVAEFCDEAAALIERDGSVLMRWSS